MQQARWTQPQVLQVVKSLVTEEFKYVRFAKRDIVDAVYEELPTLNASRELAVSQGTDLRVSEQVGSYLRAIKDEDGHRLYLNDGFYWFHRNESTPHQQKEFGQRLVNSGKQEEEEGYWHIEQARKRTKKGRNRR